jgi:diacylglycerol kinase family enzyme
VNEVVCALLESGAPGGVALAVLPLGTANDFAAALGVSVVGRRGARAALGRPIS